MRSRKRMAAGVLLLLVLTLVGLVLCGRPPPGAGVATVVEPATPALPGPPTVRPPAPPTPDAAAGAGGIRGTVKTAAGRLAPGAHVELFDAALTLYPPSPCPADVEAPGPEERGDDSERTKPRRYSVAHGSCPEAIEQLFDIAARGSAPPAPLAETWTDEEGRFALPAQDLQIHAVRAALGAATALEDAQSPTEVELVLEEPRTLQVEVVEVSSRAPVPNASVLLVHPFPWEATVGTSDAEGRVVFQAVSSAPRFVVVRAEGFLTLFGRAEPGEGVTTLELQRHGGITGEVRLGRVAASGARVTVGVEAGFANPFAPANTGVLETSTTPDGRFAFAEPPCSSCSVEAQLGSHSARKKVWTRPGVTRHVVLDLAASVRLTVHVLQDGDASSTMALLLPIVHEAEDQDGVQTESTWVATDEPILPEVMHEPFVFKALAPGEYRLRVLSPGLRTVEENVTLAAGDDLTREVRLTQGVAIRGVVVGADGRLLAGVRLEANRVIPARKDPEAGPGTDGPGQLVRLSEARLRFWEEQAVAPERGDRASATSAPDGRFTVAGLASAEYVVVARGEGLVSLRQSVVAPAQGLRLVMSREAAIAVQVLDSQGVAEPRARVRALPPAPAGSPEAWRRRAARTVGEVEEQAEGRFEIRKLPPGEYEVVADREAAVPASQRVVLAAGERVEVTLRLGETYVVSGVVVTGDGQPCAGASVSTRVLGTQRDAEVAQDGSFTLTGLPPGRVKVHARREGYTDGDGEAAAGSTGLRIVLLRELSATGRIVAPGGRAPTACTLRMVDSESVGAKVRYTGTVPDPDPLRTLFLELSLRSMRGLSGPGSRRPEVGPDGGFQCLGLDPRRDYRLFAVCAEGWAEKELRPPAPALLTLRPGGTVRAAVPGGAGATVVIDCGDLRGSEATADDAGVAVLHNVPLGACIAGASDRRFFAGARLTVVAGSNEVTLVRFASQ